MQNSALLNVRYIYLQTTVVNEETQNKIKLGDFTQCYEFSLLRVRERKWTSVAEKRTVAKEN